MTLNLDLSVILPTRGRPAALRQCLDLLARQTLDRARFETVVVFDGPDPEGMELARSFGGRLAIQAIEAARLGNAHTKNEALAAARGRIVLFLNDDVLPEPDLLQSHLDAQDQRVGQAPVLIVGHSPFVRGAAESVFEALLRRTSMIFFYDQMIDEQGRALRGPEHDWGFRHAWSLNLSAPRRLAMAVGGFRPAIANCCYEDVEFGWRACREGGARVLFHPQARAEHNHRMTPEDYLRREWRLGYSALGFALAAPQCAREIFGRDIASGAELEYARAFVERESRGEKAQLEALRALGAMEAASVPTQLWESLLPALYGQHLLLKRLAFRRGLLAASAGEAAEGLFLPGHGLATEPPLGVATAA